MKFSTVFVFQFFLCTSSMCMNKVQIALLRHDGISSIKKRNKEEHAKLMMRKQEDRIRRASVKSKLGSMIINTRAFVDAAKKGDTEKMSSILESDEHVLNHSNEQNYTALMTAALHGKEHVVRYLVDHKVDVNRQGYLNRTALMCAAQSNCFRTFHYLLQHQTTNLIYRDYFGKSARDIAAEHNNQAMVEAFNKNFNERLSQAKQKNDVIVLANLNNFLQDEAEEQKKDAIYKRDHRESTICSIM